MLSAHKSHVEYFDLLGDINKAANDVGKFAQQVGEGAKKGIDTAAGQINDTAANVGGFVNDTAGQINQTAANVGGFVNDTAGQINQTAANVGGQINDFAAKESGKLNDSLNQTGQNITTYFSPEEQEKRNKQSAISFYKFLGLSDEDAERQYQSSISRQKEIGVFFKTLVTDPQQVGENIKDSFTDDNGNFDPINGAFEVLDVISTVYGAVPIVGPVYTDAWELALDGFDYLIGLVPGPPTEEDAQNSQKTNSPKEKTKSLSEIPGLGGKSVWDNIKTVTNVLVIILFIMFISYLLS